MWTKRDAKGLARTNICHLVSTCKTSQTPENTDCTYDRRYKSKTIMVKVTLNYILRGITDQIHPSIASSVSLWRFVSVSPSTSSQT